MKTRIGLALLAVVVSFGCRRGSNTASSDNGSADPALPPAQGGSGSATTGGSGASLVSSDNGVERCKQLVPEDQRKDLEVIAQQVAGTVNCTIQGADHKSVWLVRVECPGGTLAPDPAMKVDGIGKVAEKNGDASVKFNSSKVACLVEVTARKGGDHLALAKLVDGLLTPETAPPK